MLYKNEKEMEKTFKTDFLHHNIKHSGFKGKESRKMHSHPPSATKLSTKWQSKFMYMQHSNMSN